MQLDPCERPVAEEAAADLPRRVNKDLKFKAENTFLQKDVVLEPEQLGEHFGEPGETVLEGSQV